MTYCAVLLLCFHLTTGEECAQLTLPTSEWGSGVYGPPLQKNNLLAIFFRPSPSLVGLAPTWKQNRLIVSSIPPPWLSALRVVSLDVPKVRVYIISIVYRKNPTKIVSFMMHF